MFDVTYYRQGYSLGVGGVVLYDSTILLVRSSYGAALGEWTIPGGFVERGETIDIAVQREILEETGVRANMQGLIGARNRITNDENSAYFIFLLQAESADAQADGAEIHEAGFFPLPDVQTMPNVRALTRMLALRAYEGTFKVLASEAHPAFSASEYRLFL